MAISAETPMPDRVLSKRQVAEQLGVDPTTIHRWTKAGTFPASVQLGPRRVGWRSSAVEAWLASR